jgi:hypothetical protein
MAPGGHQDRARLAIPDGLGSSDPSVAEQVTLNTPEAARLPGFTHLYSVCRFLERLSKIDPAKTRQKTFFTRIFLSKNMNHHNL